MLVVVHISPIEIFPSLRSCLLGRQGCGDGSFVHFPALCRGVSDVFFEEYLPCDADIEQAGGQRGITISYIVDPNIDVNAISVRQLFLIFQPALLEKESLNICPRAFLLHIPEYM